MFIVKPDRHSFELEQLELIRFRVDRFLLMPKHEAWLRREAFVRQAYSSTMIENATIREEELTKAESDLTVDRPDVKNYARALEFVDFLSNLNGLILDELIVRQIHWSLMSGVHDTYYLPGNYRKDTNWVEDAGIKVYQPPHQFDVPILMREFIMELRKEGLHPVLKAGVAHLHLVAIHPFVDGNGRAARLLATLLLQNSGWGFRNILSLDNYYQRNRNEYIGGLSSTLGSKFSQDYDATPWLEFFCRSVLLGAQLLEGRLTEWQMMVDKIHKDMRPSGLLDRQIDGFIYAARRGEITRRDYVEVAGVSPLTATRDLALLVKQGYLKAEGLGRNRAYKLARPVSTKGVNKHSVGE
ncbi:MAG: Fic family protein [Chloroflexi bacterium]|nr:Fic family protein [Chloroflexota bacterium]